MPVDYHAVIADLEDRGNQMLETARALRELMVAKPVVPVVKAQPVKKRSPDLAVVKTGAPVKKRIPDVTGQMTPLSESIRRFVDGTRTAVQIADAVEVLYPDRDQRATRDNVSTQLSQWQSFGKVRKDSEGRVSFVEAAPAVR